MGINDYFVVARFSVEDDQWVLEIMTPSGDFRSNLLPKTWKRLAKAEEHAAKCPGAIALFSRYYLDIWGHLIQLRQKKLDGKPLPPVSQIGVAVRGTDGWNLEIRNLGVVHIERSNDWDIEMVQAKAREIFPSVNFKIGQDNGQIP